jgi:alpha-glucoside transport system substrate-binding protein
VPYDFKGFAVQPRFLRRAMRWLAVALATATSAALLAGTPAQASPATTVSIFGSFQGEVAQSLQAELDIAFPPSSGIKAVYTPLSNFEASINLMVGRNQMPNIVLWNEPSALLAYKSKLVSLGKLLGAAKLAKIESTLASGWVPSLSVGSSLFALPIDVSPRDLVFYNRDAFRANKLQAPRNDGELIALQNQIISRGLGYPWCFGLEAGPATGAPAFNWIKAYALKQLGPAQFSDWLSGKIKWTSSPITAVGNRVSAMLTGANQVQGGAVGASTRNFAQTTASGLFANGKVAGQCFMMLGSVGSTSYLPTSVQSEIANGNYTHLGVFELPTPNTYQQSQLLGGDFASTFQSDPATAQVMEYLVGDKFGSKGLISHGYFYSAHKSVPLAQYGAGFRRQIASIIQSNGSIGVDRQLVSNGVNTNLIWSNLTGWFAGKTNMAKAFSTIDAGFKK